MNFKHPTSVSRSTQFSDFVSRKYISTGLNIMTSFFYQLFLSTSYTKFVCSMRRKQSRKLEMDHNFLSNKLSAAYIATHLLWVQFRFRNRHTC